MKKSIFFWLYFIVAIVLAVYFATRIIINHVSKTSTQNVHNVYIINKNPQEDLKLVEESIGITRGTHIKSINLKKINEQIDNIPGIKKSAVRLLPNGNIIIKIEFHKAVALLEEDNMFYPLSEDGTKINTPSTTKSENTIVLKGSVPNNIAEIIQNLSPLVEQIDFIDWIEDRRWNIHTKTGITIMLPEKNPLWSITQISNLNQSNNILSRKIKTIDMRDKARILVIPIQ